jgi:hypothetical protein
MTIQTLIGLDRQAARHLCLRHLHVVETRDGLEVRGAQAVYERLGVSHDEMGPALALALDLDALIADVASELLARHGGTQ